MTPRRRTVHLSRRAPTEGARHRGLWSYLSRRPSLAADLFYVAPLLWLYQVGTLQTGDRNGADFVTTLLLRAAARWPWAGPALLGASAVAVLWLYVHLRRREAFRLGMTLPLLGESAVYALGMGNLILVVLVHGFGITPPHMAVGEAPLPLARVLVISAGAGVHEELVFRVGLLGGLAAVLRRGMGLRPLLAAGIALAVSSALFSAAHHLPPHGEPFTPFAFWYRTLAGALFGLLYLGRGFATAAHAHFLYDVLVLWAWR